MNNIVTCVYCGVEYPKGTPSHGSNILTDHISKCEKHPMSKLKKKYDKISEKYNELLMNVGRKFPGESRHETALRYIKDKERLTSDVGW